MPFGQGRRWLSKPGVIDVLLGGWAITAIGSYQSGFPNVIAQDNNNSGLLGSFQRPNLTGTDPATSGSTEDRLNNWFNQAAWSQAAPFTFGDAPRTDTRARTPFKKNWDIAFQKTQPIGGQTIMVRIELINVFDDPNFLGPETRFGRSAFGRITQVGGFPRTVQLLARFGW